MPTRSRRRPSVPPVVETIDEALAQLYRLERTVQAKDFVVPSIERLPGDDRGALLVREGEDLELALVFHPRVEADLHKIKRRTTPLSSPSLDSLSVAVEEVSHFRYLVFRAEGEAQSVTTLELELQGEIDRFVLLLLWESAGKNPTAEMFDALFEKFFATLRLRDGLTTDQVERYRTAHDMASAYLRAQRTTILASQLEALRRFYRLSFTGKAEEIHQRKAA